MMAPERFPIAVLMHDGFYGCGTGAGTSNRTLLQELLAHSSPSTDILVMPIRLDPSSSEYDESWHAATKALLAQTGSVIEALDNGTHGQLRFGGLENFRRVVHDASCRLHRRFAGTNGMPWIIALDVPFLGLGSVLGPELAKRLILVPRSTARIHAPGDLDRVAWESAALQEATDRGARVAAISAFMRSHLQTDYSVDARHIIDLPNGLVDADWRQPAGQALPLPPHAADSFMLCMGRATPYKGYDDVLDALQYLKRQGGPVPHTVLAAVTDGPVVTDYQRHLAWRIQSEHLNVSLVTSFSPAIRALLWHPALCAVLVPSQAEPFGRIPIEAHAAGAAPVVTTTAGGLSDQVIDGVTGFTCDPHDPLGLAAAIHRALSLDPEARREMRDRAGRDVRRRFDHSAAVRTFIKQLGRLGD
ncbi:glycosyltransferase family 4 protein [Kribbella sp. NPDC023972]|uniref:glycosyltransferase family 4 protein n=1 Tax=Kribbella sp. NPDC023972 TaxID=3154795 RepID=UPI0033D9EE37